MSKKGFRWDVAAVSAVLTLALLSLGYFVYANLGVRKPLEKALMADPDVISVDMGPWRGSEAIQVEIANVTDFPATYARLHQLVRDKAGMKQGFRIVDERNQELIEAYHSIHYYLEEARTNANFGEMIEFCQEALKDKDLDSFRFAVDKDRIYVQMAKGEAYLFEVLERAPEGGGGEQS
ncbi:MAG: hypothetical protein ACOX3V_06890 [Bacillota bacterium]